MFGIDLTEFIVIFVLAMIMFGPEKLPQYSRKAARLFVYFRDIANNAKTTLRTELGPEFADLELTDLHPKAFIAKQLREEVALIEDAKRELLDAKSTLTDSAKLVQDTASLNSLKDAVAEGSALEDPPAMPRPWSGRRSRPSTLKLPNRPRGQIHGLVGVPRRLLVWMRGQHRPHGLDQPIRGAHRLDAHLLDHAQLSPRAGERVGSLRWQEAALAAGCEAAG